MHTFDIVCEKKTGKYPRDAYSLFIYNGSEHDAKQIAHRLNDKFQSSPMSVTYEPLTIVTHHNKEPFMRKAKRKMEKLLNPID